MHTVTIRGKADAENILGRAKSWITRRVADGRAVTLTLEDERRNNSQNALLHAILTEISRTHEWAGQKRDVETWKRLMVAAWCRAKGEQVEMLPAIDGHGFDIVFRRTSKMSKAEVAELIDYVEAWRAGA